MTEPASPPSYKDTLNLPKTSFDMKANLTQREPKMVAQWAADNLYQKIRARQHPKGKWVLHDGPPYANGDIHMGHLINKVLKDIVVKFRTMQGHDAPYVPGWDCHGLPIESAIQKELGPKFRELSKDELRKKCADYAMKYVKLQGDSFQRLGILGSFDNPYLTMDPKYEAGILEVLAELVKNDLVYRQKKPVHWCTNDRTALAEAELEYASKKDHSIFVALRLKDASDDPKIRELTRSELKKSRERFTSGAVLDGADPSEFPEGQFDQIRASLPSFAKMLDPEKFFGKSYHHDYLVIWTTTPWTLPANRAVAINPDAEYAYVIVQNDHDTNSKTMIIAKDLVDRVMKAAGKADYEISSTFPGKKLVEWVKEYEHPIEPERFCPVVLADYVTLEDGTGLVHTAPGHGKEDYATGQKYHLETYNPVLADGRYDDTVPEFLRGKTIWDANQLIIDKLKESGALFHHAEFSHDYPHCWRCKKPTIQRATEQWFVRASGETQSEPRPSGSDHAAHEPTPQSKIENQKSKIPSLWSSAKSFVTQTQWIPAWGKNRIDGMLDTRPDWCISRQRSWGVPIPAFFDDKGNLLFTEKTVRTLAAHFKQHGADSWYTHTPAQLLGLEENATYTDTAITTEGKILSSFVFRLSSLTKGSDILDVWFESGASHHAVLESTHPELGYPADLYLEGSDQHRGWFQSSLLEAAGYKPVPPFKAVLTHGFVVDEKGQKYSKSSGNFVPVDKLLQQNGADVLRLYVSSVDYQSDIKFSPAHIASASEAYRKIRNTIRYLLGNLYDFNPTTDMTAPNPHSIDAWMQSKVDTWAAAVQTAYDTYEFHNVFKLIYEFCNVEISALYAKAIKDRLYCELPNSPKRRASQSVCYRALVHLIELSAPVLAFTAEEAWSELRKLPGCSSLAPSIHLRTFSNLKSEISNLKSEIPTSLAYDWQVLMPLIEKGNKILDDLKRTVGLGNPLDAEAVIVVGFSDCIIDATSKMDEYGPEIEDALGVGFHRVEFKEPPQGGYSPFNGQSWDIRIEDTRTKYPSCARSWKRRPDVGSDKDFPDLSARDAAVVRTLRASS